MFYDTQDRIPVGCTDSASVQQSGGVSFCYWYSGISGILLLAFWHVWPFLVAFLHKSPSATNLLVLFFSQKVQICQQCSTRRPVRQKITYARRAVLEGTYDRRLIPEGQMCQKAKYARRPAPETSLGYYTTLCDALSPLGHWKVHG